MSEPEISWDYETYSACSIKDGGWKYAAHPSTDVLCLGYRIGKEKVRIWHRDMDKPLDLLHGIKHGLRLWAFNANFERAITEHVLKRIFPAMTLPRVDQYRCTQALAAMCSLPMKLETVAKILGTDAQKDKNGKRLLKLFSQPRTPTKADPRTRIRPQDDRRSFKELCDYCIQDVYTEQAVRDALPIQTLPKFERKVWAVDSTINSRGILIDTALARGALKVRAEATRHLASKLPKLTGNVVTKPTQIKRIKAWAAKLGARIGSLGKDTIQKYLDDKTIPKVVRTVIKIRAATAQTSINKYGTMLRMVGADDRVRGAHAYHAAGPGRWGGRGVQTQNLKRPDDDVADFRGDIQRADYKQIAFLHKMPLTVLADCIRHAIIASPGRVLGVCDLASIEARVLGWLVGEEKYLDAFRKGLDLYKVTAASIFRVSYEDVTDEQRFLGKESVLGLGYQMGEETFDKNCKKKGLKAPRSLIHRAHVAYRKTYKKIVNYWYDVERVAVRACLTRKAITFKRCAFEMIGDYFTVKLPSGRRLWYPFAKVKNMRTRWGSVKPTLTFMSEPKPNMWVRVSTYGGKLTENIVQAIARDILAEGLVRSEAEGLRPIMHVHDEILCDGKPGVGAKLAAIMKTIPRWGGGMPLDAKAFESPYYKKG